MADHGTLWMPAREKQSLPVEVTTGCSHGRCKFCTMYEGIPFRVLSMDEVESQLERMMTYPLPSAHTRAFLAGANAFTADAGRLISVTHLITSYFPAVRSFGAFARITDVARKSDGELRSLAEAGFSNLWIGMETGDDEALQYMDKGFHVSDTLAQCRRLTEAGLSYSFFFIAGLSGKGRGEQGARRTAELCNRLCPLHIDTDFLTLRPKARLRRELDAGLWEMGSAAELYRELRTLAQELTIPVTLDVVGGVSSKKMSARLPEERASLLERMDMVLARLED